MPRADMRRAYCAALAPLLLIAARPAAAGPTQYDPKARVFDIKYTYAALPSSGMSPPEIEQLGSPQKATVEQDANIRSIIHAAGKILEEVTGKRARIGSLGYVNSVRRADLIVSMTGAFDRAAWATAGQIEGRPGQIGVYYRYLERHSKEEFVLTVAHQLLHYLFALPDEYASNPAGVGCPVLNGPQAPGCLMDNYYDRHGFRKLCSDADHNHNAPRQNPGTILQGHRAEDSCQSLVDHFFKSHPAAPDGEGGRPAVEGSPPPTASPGGASTGQFQRAVDSTILFVRDQVAQEAAKRGERKQAGTGLSDVRLRTLANRYLGSQIKDLARDPNFPKPTPTQMAKAITEVVQAVPADPRARPSRFNQDVIARLRSEARRLAGAVPRKRGSLLESLLGDPAAVQADLKPAIAAVTRGLHKSLATPEMRALVFGGAPPSPDADERRFIEQIAREAVTGTIGSTDMVAYHEAALLHARLSLDAQATLNNIASELDLPGAERRALTLQDLTARLSGLCLPGKPFSYASPRKTYIVAPMPVDPAFDRVRIDVGDDLPYRDVRNLIVAQFARMLGGERSEAVANLQPFGFGSPGRLRPELVEGDWPANNANRFAQLVGMVAQLVEEVRRNRVDGIIFVVPPGGLMAELSDALEGLRVQVLDSDVRVDILLADRGTIPMQLRDLTVRSGGSVQLLPDLDEVGAIAQRIRSEISDGSWVAAPQQGYIDFTGLGGDLSEPSRGRRDPRRPMNIEDLQAAFKAPDAPGSQGGGDGWSPQLALPREGVPRLRPALDRTAGQIDFFNERLDFSIGHFVRDDARPSTYTRIVEARSGLNQLKLRIDEIGRLLDRLQKGRRDRSGRAALRELSDAIRRAKQSLRPMFGTRDHFQKPLTDTDDSFDWTLRKLIIQHAAYMREAYAAGEEEAAGAGDQGRREWAGRVLLKSSSLWKRAAIEDQQLADFEHALEVNEAQAAISADRAVDPGGEGAAGAKEQAELRQEIGAIRAALEELRRAEAPRGLGSSSLLLRAAEDLSRAIDRLDGNAKQAGDGHRPVFIAGLVLRMAWLLEQASEAAVDPAQFAGAVAGLRRHVEKLPMNPAGAPPEFEPPAERARDLLRVLNQRSERLLGRAGTDDRRLGSPNPGSALEDEDAFDKSNSLSPILDSLKPDRDMAGLEELKKEYRGPERERLLRRMIDPRDPDLALVHRERVERLVYADYPSLILDILCRLRDFEQQLHLVGTDVDGDDRPRPRFERLARRRMPVLPSSDREGGLVEVAFEPFAAEDGADIEVVIGLSRPLRHFDDLRDTPPALRLSRGEKGDAVRLAEQPHLRFDAGLSTDTMLVFRSPKPSLRVGLLAAGTYTPRLLLHRRLLPIPGRDNAANATLSVATSRPNVCLIAGLRQPRPMEGARDPEEDKAYASRGTIPADVAEAIAEVEVLAGAPVLNSEVIGFFQQIDDGADLIESFSIDFADDGVYPDLKKDDGVYTTRITLRPSALRRPSDYRLFIQARSTSESRFIPLAEPAPGKADGAPPALPHFQRATSLDFHVSGEG
jgi:hypothetical protein